MTVVCLGFSSSFQNDNPRKKKYYFKFTTTLQYLFCYTSVRKTKKIQRQLNMDDNLDLNDSGLFELLK
jgi:hypothetical protein